MESSNSCMVELDTSFGQDKKWVQYFDLLNTLLAKEQVEDGEINDINNMELRLSRQRAEIMMNTDQWDERSCVVVNFSSDSQTVTSHVFLSEEEAMAFSQMLQMEKYQSNENPYFIGTVFYKKKTKRRRIDDMDLKIATVCKRRKSI